MGQLSKALLSKRKRRNKKNKDGSQQKKLNGENKLF